MHSFHTRFGLLLSLLVMAGCTTTRQTPSSDRAEPSSFPGFDLWQYPGDEAMAEWRAESPYQWVGYYLPAPCRRDSSWAGTRAALERMGWGTAVLYVGQQVFESEPESSEEEGPIVCSRTLLTAEQGRIDARDAVSQAASEGFPAGTVLFLDVEKAVRLPDVMLIYHRAWTEAVFADGRYRPGTYAHRENAVALFREALAVAQANERTEAPPFWIAGGSGFALDRTPSDVGVPFATVWQGVLDAERTWGGRTLRIDENVAMRPSPSAPRGDSGERP